MLNYIMAGHEKNLNKSAVDKNLIRRNTKQLKQE